MAVEALRRVVRALPPIRRRDAALAERADELGELRAEVRTLQGALRERPQPKKPQPEKPQPVASSERATDGPVNLLKLAETPSFSRQLFELRRGTAELRPLDPDKQHPLRQMPFKLRNYRLAASHGMLVPEVYGTWSQAAEIDLGALPDTFVVKSDQGAGSHGVLPLRRTGDDAYTVAGGRAVLSGNDVRHRLGAKVSLRGPYFAEEMLVQDGGGSIPDDIKIYAAYGEILQVLLRRVDKHGDLSRTRFRYVDAAGRALGQVVPGVREDLRVPVPERLEEMLEIARHLSRAVALSFVRVDLYDTSRGIVFGELTRCPGERKVYYPEHDAAMGLAWGQARWRLELDILRGRSAHIIYGPYPAPNPYPASHVSASEEPGTWAPQVYDCDQWCR